MFKKIFLSLMLVIAILSFTACKANTNSSNSNKLKVVVSFNAMKELTYAIGKDKIEITNMTPNGTEPHDFEPKTKDILALQEAKVFIYNGLDMESWVDKALNSIDNKNLIKVEASKGITPIKNTSSNEHGTYDPHAWLSLKAAEIESKNIKDALIKADPKNKNYYEKNYSDFKVQIDNLYNEYKDKFKGLNNKSFVTGHAAFGYLCRDYDLNQESVEDVFAEGEPSTKKLTDLITYCKKNNVKTIFVEDMVSPKVSNTLAREVGAKVEKIYTVESCEDGKNYLQSMKYNLEKIYSSLQQK